MLFLSTKEITADTGGEGFLIDDQFDQWFLDDRFFAGDSWGLSHATYDTWFPGERFFDEEQAQTYKFGVIDFSRVTLLRTNSESGIFAPGELTFSIENQDHYLEPDQFEGGTVHVAESLKDSSDENVVRRFLFRIKTAEPGYQKIHFTCEDFLQKYLRGSYPNTRLVKDLFQSSDINQDDSVCVPEPYGTAYVPLRSVYKSGLLTETATDISATASATGSRCKFTRAAGWDESYEVGRVITISGFSTGADNGTFILLAKTGNDLEIAIDAGLVTDAGGESVTIAQGSRPYLLGPSAHTYTITEVRSPREWGKLSTWTSGSYTFTQHTFTDVDGTSWKGVLPIIADINSDGTADAPGYWQSGDIFMDMPVELTRSDTSAMTSPADIIKRVLINMGVPAGKIDLVSFAVAKAVFTSWGLEWNGAFWYKQDRAEVLRVLLSMCHSYLIVTDHIELHTYSATSQKTILKKDVVKDSFSYRDVIELPVSDSGYVAYITTGEAQDKFYKVLVPAKGSTRTQYSSEVLPLPFVQGSVDAQTLGTLYFQKKLTVNGEIDFDGQPPCLALCPGDVITPDNWDYGGRFDALIDSITYNKNHSISIRASRFSVALDDYDDLSPSVIIIPDDDTTEMWTPPMGGPLSDQDVGQQAFEVWGNPHLVVGPNTNRAKYTDTQTAINALSESRHNGIYILGGTYALPDVVYIPNRDIEILGESRGAVHIENKAGDFAFRVGTDFTSKAKFSSFTIDSQNAGTNVETLLSIGDYAGVDISGDFMIEKIDFNLKNQSLWGANGDRGIALYDITGTVKVTQCGFFNGERGLDTYTLDDFDLSFCTFSGNTVADAYIDGYNLSINVSNLVSTDFYKYSLWLRHQGGGKIGIAVIDKVRSVGKAIAGAAKWQQGIVVKLFDSQIITGNIINIVHTATGATDMGIYVQNPALSSGIASNQVTMDLDHNGLCYGMYLDGFNLGGGINNNYIKVDNIDNTSNHYGYFFQSSGYNVFQGNYAYGVNNDAKDIGIHFSAASVQNIGGDNYTYSVGSSIVDIPGTNAGVTAKDI